MSEITTETIRMVDLATQYKRLQPAIDKAMQKVLDETSFISGPIVKEFSTNLATHIRAKQVIPCANGTDALQIALMALDLQPGNEIITSAFTFIATAEVIVLLGLQPVFVDVNPDDFNINISAIEKAITPKTKVILPVHLFGQCSDMESILALAKKHNLYVVEDTAQAIGAEYTFSNGTKQSAGTMGNIGTTSFFPSKNLGCFGDGGALMTNSEELAKKSMQIANHGSKVRYYHDVVGINSRLDSIQAAVLNEKLKHLNDFSARRNKAASFYDENLKGIAGLKTPYRSKNSTHVFHQYTLQIEGGKRDALKAHLEQKGIPAMVYYPLPLHKQEVFKEMKNLTLPVTEKLAETVLSLPMHTELTESQLNYICATIKEFFN
ncbi:MAG: DegT/DnrJ/EryC1/StrS family aminotransferase [Flavobacteriales bacterium]